MATVKVVRQCSFDSQPPLPPKNRYFVLYAGLSNFVSSQIFSSSSTPIQKKSAPQVQPQLPRPDNLKTRRTLFLPSFLTAPDPAGHELSFTSLNIYTPHVFF